MKKLPKGSEIPPKKGAWIKKGWVIKKVVNIQPNCFTTNAPYPPLPCPRCKFYPCYADAYGTYRCPRCDCRWKSATIAAEAKKYMKQCWVGPGTWDEMCPEAGASMMATRPAKTCPYCGYYPCYYDTTCGCYKCPRCGKLFQ